MTHLRKIMLEELQRRNYSDATIRHYLRMVEDFARHFGKSPDKLGLEHLRSYQAYLLKTRKLSVGSVENHVAALRFFFVRTLSVRSSASSCPIREAHRQLPGILSKEEVGTADRCQLQPVPAHPADGSLRHRHAPHRSRPSEAPRHRQPAHDHPRGRRQGRQGPRSAPEPGVAGDAARLLALAQAAGRICFPRARAGTSINLSPTRPCGLPAAKPRKRPAFASALRRTRCATAGPRICSKAEPICAPSSFCSATAIWRLRRSICTFAASICSRCQPARRSSLSSVDESRRAFHRPHKP